MNHNMGQNVSTSFLYTRLSRSVPVSATREELLINILNYDGKSISVMV